MQNVLSRFCQFHFRRDSTSYVSAREPRRSVSVVMTGTKEERLPVADYRGPLLYTTADSYAWRQRIMKEDEVATNLQNDLREAARRQKAPERPYEPPLPPSALSLALAKLGSSRAREEAARRHINKETVWPVDEYNQFMTMSSFSAPPVPTNRPMPWRAGGGR